MFMISQDKVKIKGIYRDVLYNEKGQIKFDSGWRANLIVNEARTMLAAFMKDDPTGGIQQLQIGQGYRSWDDKMPTPEENAVKLVNASDLELTKANERLELEYLNESNSVVQEPQPRIQVRVTLGIDEPPTKEGSNFYPLREFGLFGQFGGETYMIDYVIHPVIHKEETDTLIRTIRLIF